MPEIITYSTNDQIQNHVPIKFTSRSRPTTQQIAGFRQQIYGMINMRLGGVAADPNGGLRDLEISKVLILVDNYWARGRGERTEPVFITDDELRIIQMASEDVAGNETTGGHYSIEVP